MNMDSASHVLNEMHYPDEFSLLALILGYANSSRMKDARIFLIVQKVILVLCYGTP